MGKITVIHGRIRGPLRLAPFGGEKKLVLIFNVKNTVL